MSQKIVDICHQAVQVNYSQPLRKGNIIELPDNGSVILSGDTHGHRRNFERIVNKADLQNNPDTYVVFQEILHGGPEDEFGGCLSFELYYDILEYQLAFPKQVILIMGNHDTAIINDIKVLKNGREMNEALKAAMRRRFAENFDEVYAELKFCLLSQPLAIKTPNRIWMSHSLPSDPFVDDFDTSLFTCKLAPADLAKPKPAYQLTWGRKHSQKALDTLAETLDADIFLLGHQAQETGWKKAGDNLIILASDHNHGSMIKFDLDKNYSIQDLADRIVPLASLE